MDSQFSVLSQPAQGCLSLLIHVTMEAMKTEQDGAAISDLEQFMVGNVAWDTMVQM